MKIAAISDIHSNVFALESVIADVEARKIDLVVNLGDVFYGPMEPRATYDLLAKRNYPTICGNQDRQIYDATPEEIASNPTMAYVIEDLGDEPLAWLQKLPFDTHLTDDIYLCHGSPQDDMEYLLEDVSNGHASVRADSDIIRLMTGVYSPLVICGHTHIPRTVVLSTGQLIVNPGSVGLPAYSDDLPVAHAMENYSAHASYAIIEKHAAGWVGPAC